MVTDMASPDDLLTPAEVAVLFRVSPKTVTRWAIRGRLGFVRTLGGHRRFRRGDVEEMLTHTVQSATNVPSWIEDQPAAATG